MSSPIQKRVGTEKRKPASVRPPDIIRTRSGYTRFVGAMKLVLPLAAAAIAVTVVIWPQFQDKPSGFHLTVTDMDIGDVGGQKVINPKFRGRDSNNQPYVVTADEARQYHDDPEHVNLKNPKAGITLSSGAWVALSAPWGRLRKESSTLVLSGGIRLSHDSGHEIRTDRANVDLKRGTAHGADPVSGEGPLGALTAAGFRIFESDGRILFTGKSRLVLHEDKETNKGLRP